MRRHSRFFFLAPISSPVCRHALTHGSQTGGWSQDAGKLVRFERGYVSNVAIPSLVGPTALSRLPVIEMLVGLALFVAACVSFWLTMVPGGIALFWPGSAIAAAILIRLPKVRWISAAMAVSVGVFAANILVAHRPWGLAALFAGINVAEVALMVFALRFVWRLPYPALSVANASTMAVVFGIVIPGMGAVFAGAVLQSYLTIPWSLGTLQWWSSHTVGACLVGPPIILFSRKGLIRLWRPRFRIANALTAIGCLAGSYLAIRYVRFPFVSIGLLLTVAAFHMGGLGASLMSLSVGLLITNLWIFGVFPVGLGSNTAINGAFVGLPVIALLATVMPPIAVGLGSDARRAAARALTMSERRFRASMEHSPIGMLIADLDGTWEFTNLALQKMLGFTAEEFRAMPPGGPSKKEDWEESDSRRSRLLARETDFYDVARCFRHKNDGWVWTHVAVSILRDDEGNPLQFIAQIESMEARRQSEATLAAERERLRITLESISDAVVTTDAATRIAYMNSAAENLLGLDLRAVESRRVDEVIYLMDADTGTAAANLIGQSVHHAEVFRREQPCLLHRADGTICYVTDVVSPVVDSAGALSGLVIVFRDASGDMDRSRDLHYRALHDSLTGLSNRADFNLRLRQAFTKAQALDRSAFVIAIDLDRFKAVNDAGGHAAGDAVLRKVADSCRNLVRSSDTVARLGGDEFGIILGNCTGDRAQRIAAQLVEALNSLTIEADGVHYSIGASVGLAAYVAGMPDEVCWLAAADKACYTAKREGRGRLRSAPQALQDELLSHSRIA